MPGDETSSAKRSRNGDERAPDLGAALVIDAAGVVDEHAEDPPGSDLHVDDVDRGQGGAEHALDVLCDRFCVPYSHMSVSSWPAVMTGPGHKKGGSENPPFSTCTSTADTNGPLAR